MYDSLVWYFGLFLFVNMLISRYDCTVFQIKGMFSYFSMKMQMIDLLRLQNHIYPKYSGITA